MIAPGSTTMAVSDPVAPIGRRIVRCPGCGGESIYTLDNPWRPFCSERCRGVDLGAWSSEGYRVAIRPDAAAADDDAATLPPD